MEKPWVKKKLASWVLGGLATFWGVAACTDELWLKESPVRNHSVSPDWKREQGLWSITVSHMRLPAVFEYIGITGWPGLPDPVHNFINVRDSYGELMYSFHGLTTDPETREPQAWSILPGYALRAYPLPASVSKYFVGGYGIDTGDGVETDIFCGSHKEVEQKLLACLDACHFINQQELSYNLLNQNSNSVASSLVAAMGLEFPQENVAFWAPGANQSLLPENWSPNYDSAKVETMFGDHLDNDLSGLHIKFSKTVETDPEKNITRGTFPEELCSRENMRFGILYLRLLDRLIVQMSGQLSKMPAPQALHSFNPANPVKPYIPVRMLAFEEFVELLHSSLSEPQAQQAKSFETTEIALE